MSIKEHIERNPFVYLIIVVISVVSITIAVDNYFWSKKVDSMKFENRKTIDKYQNRLASIKSENQRTIERYQDRLASIERRIGSRKVIDQAGRP